MMIGYETILESILKEHMSNALKISPKEIEDFASALQEAKRIFVAGAGRSGFVAKAFANRLMHLGFQVYCVGDSTTPAIGEGDLLVISSGSGQTGGLVQMANKAVKFGASIATVTIHPEAAIGGLAKSVICIPGTSPLSTLEDTVQSVQPGSSAFEQMSWMVFDTVIMILMDKIGKTEEEMLELHANLE